MAVTEVSGLMKYRDANGNVYLMLPITTKDNVDGIDEIEAQLAETLRYTEQSLTDGQKEIARNNIGVNDADFITVGDIDSICGASIKMASEVTF